MSEPLDGAPLNGAELLEAARATLTADLAPHLPGERRYELLMADNAMGIAARELAAGEAPARRALERLAALYRDQIAAASDDPREALRTAEARLAADIRAGRFDEGQDRPVAAAHLRERALAATRISNPRFLQRRSLE